MVGGAASTNQQPHASQLAPPPSSSMTEEEEFLKRNTDCVYFLASPLTCKKGSECEYRHSDIARVNPRDCWYWLNGNCLNPKCGFRHPPLDGLLEAEAPPPVVPAATQAPAKQGVACIFFQKGFCLKGHLCPFWHGSPNMVHNVPVQPVQPVQPVPPNPVTKPAKVASAGPAGPEKFIQEQKFTQQETVQKPTKFPPQMQPRNGGGGGVMEKKVAATPEEPPRYKPANVVPPPVVNEVLPSRSNFNVYESNHVSDNEGVNGKDVDEYSREPTPGFDVLVDNELGDSEYYPNEEQFGMGRPVDYDVDREVRDMYHEQRDFDRFNKEEYAWADNRDISDFGRKRYPRDESPDRFDQSDLRHRISKQRRGNNGGGLRSVISRDSYTDHHNDRHHDRQMDSGPLSSRLRGRIKIPGGYEHGSRVEREIDMGRRQRARYSPGRPPYVSSNNSRFRERIKGRSNDDYYRHYRGNDRSNDRGNDREFTGPKRRVSESRSLQPESQRTDGKLSFEGPKPLSEILKRKRGSVVNNEDKEDNETEIKETIESVNVVNEKSTASLNHEAGSIDEDALLDEELEGYDHRDGDYEYEEQIDGEEYNLEEGEEEEYMEEGDDHESGKKESEVYS